MARANRHYIPDCVWHITHRCHKQEFLLKFKKDRQRWLWWLFEAKKRFGLKILNYVVTSNHIHLLVLDSGKEVISKSIQLIAGRSAQEFNQRKKRKGAFWEDRYHATAIQTDQHLMRCFVYIDLNMVRAGVVKHPAEWTCGGYNEIQNPRERYSLIDQKVLLNIFGTIDSDQLQENHRHCVEKSVKSQREPNWTESVAVGSKDFVAETKSKLEANSRGRNIENSGDDYVLKETQNPYNTVFATKKGFLSRKNEYFWDIY
jgi:REP element-mobilizing transposase RayT